MLTTRPEMRGQRGFAIFSALFILVFMALLSAAIATIAASSQMGSAVDMSGAQARQAARAGAEWGLNRAWNADASACSTAGIYSNFAAPLFGGMAVTVHCQTAAVNEVPARTAYSITTWACSQPHPSTARCPGNASQIASPTYVERKIFVMIER